MKLIRTAKSKSKISMTKKEWEKIGRKGGWFRSASLYRGPGSGTSEKEVTLYRDSDGFISPFDNGGKPFEATIEYTYHPEEEPEYDGGHLTYPGMSARVEIESVTDEKGEDVELQPREIEELMETYDLVRDYEEEAEDEYESSLGV